ncbi:MAG: 30S ribosomal protein S20 [Pirellulales bacterium]|nr:30S ribosomal protein S20 [Pirellulales bacterium]
MPNTKSAKKRHRQSLERRARNRATKSTLKTLVKKVRVAVKEGNGTAASEALKDVQTRLDKAAAQGVIHKNAAARVKSRLSAAVKGAEGKAPKAAAAK